MVNLSISKSEQQALFTSKRIEGKSIEDSQAEIMRDLSYLRNFSQLKKENEREIKALEKLKAKLHADIEKARHKLTIAQNQAIKSISQPESYASLDSNGKSDKANTVILKRVIHYAQAGHAIHSHNIREVAKELCINSSQASDAIDFINKFVEIKKE